VRDDGAFDTDAALYDPVLMTSVAMPRLPGLRTLLVALLVPAIGAAFGAAAFAYEYAQQAWRPETTRTATGWRIVEPGGRAPSAPSVAGDKLVWTWGPNTILMDLTNGKTRLLGAGTPPSQVMPATISESYALFSESELDGSQTAYVYDVSSGKRQRLPAGLHVPDSGVLSGETVLSIVDRGVTGIHAYDLATGAKSVVVDDGVAWAPILADGALVAWHPRSSTTSWTGASVLLVKDTASGKLTTVPPPPGDPNDSATPTGWVALRDGKLLGLGSAPGQAGATVLVRDIETGATLNVGTAEPGTLPSMDSRTVAWIERDAGLFGATRIVSSRLDGSQPFEIAKVNGAVSAVSVDSGWVAWTTHGIAKSWIETARLPE